MVCQRLPKSTARSSCSPRPNHSFVIAQFNVDVDSPPKLILASIVPHMRYLGTNRMAGNSEVATCNRWDRVLGVESDHEVVRGGRHSGHY